MLNASCRTATPDEASCFLAVTWAHVVGLNTHPEWMRRESRHTFVFQLWWITTLCFLRSAAAEAPPDLLAAGVAYGMSPSVLHAVFNGSTVAAPPYNGGTSASFHVSGLDLASKTASELRSGDNLRHYQLDRLKPGAVVVDLGGNIGIVGVLANLLGGAGQPCSRVSVVSVEPLPETYLMLRWNLRENGVRELPHTPLDRGPQACGGVAALNHAITADGRNATFLMGSRAMMARIEGVLPSTSFDAIGGQRDKDLATRPAVGGIRSGYRRCAHE